MKIGRKYKITQKMDTPEGFQDVTRTYILRSVTQKGLFVFERIGFKTVCFSLWEVKKMLDNNQIRTA